jgi:hypothetical protein
MNELLNTVLSVIEVNAETQPEFESLMKDFFHNLNHLWSDIGLSDFIMSKVNNELTQNEVNEIQTPTVAARYFLPLLKISTKEKTASPESQTSSKKNNKKNLKTANVHKAALNFDSLNLQGINLLFEQVDKVITSSNEVRSFQYVAKFAIIILEVSSVLSSSKTKTTPTSSTATI